MFGLQFKKPIMSTAVAVALVFGVGTMMPDNARAATCLAGDSATAASPALDTSDVTIDFMGGTLAASACAGLYDGNDVGSGGKLLNLLNGGLFAGLNDDWSLFGKSDEAGSGVTAPEATSGEFSINFTPNAFSTFVVSLKSSTFFAAYLFDLTPDALTMVNGDFTMFGRINPANNKQLFQDLSHLSVVTYGDATVVPIPAAGILLITALGGIGVATRRRRKSS